MILRLITKWVNRAYSGLGVVDRLPLSRRLDGAALGCKDDVYDAQAIVVAEGPFEVIQQDPDRPRVNGLEEP